MKYKLCVTILPKRNGERKERLTLEAIDEQGNCRAVGIQEFLENAGEEYNTPMKHLENTFYKALLKRANFSFEKTIEFNQLIKRLYPKQDLSLCGALTHLKEQGALKGYRPKTGIVV